MEVVKWLAEFTLDKEVLGSIFCSLKTFLQRNVSPLKKEWKLKNYKITIAMLLE